MITLGPFYTQRYHHTTVVEMPNELPRLFGAVGARWRHVNVLSMNSSLSLPSEYL
jgi:hypothetical protein